MGRTTEYFKGTGLLLCRESISTAQVRKFSLRARTVHSARRRGALTFVQRPARMIALCRILDKQSHFELDAHEAACFPDAVLCQPSHGNCSHKTADAGGVKPFMDTFGRLCCLCCLKSCLSTPNEVNRSTPSPMCISCSVSGSSSFVIAASFSSNLDGICGVYATALKVLLCTR